MSSPHHVVLPSSAVSHKSLGRVGSPDTFDSTGTSGKAPPSSGSNPLQGTCGPESPKLQCNSVALSVNDPNAVRQSLAVARDAEDYNRILSTIGKPNFYPIRELLLNEGAMPSNTIPGIQISFELFETVQARLANTKQTLERTKSSLYQSNQENIALQTRCSQLKEQYAAAQKKMKDVEENSAELHAHAAKLDSAIEQLRVEAAQLRSALELSHDKQGVQEARLQEAQNRVAELLITISQKEATVGALRREVKKYLPDRDATKEGSGDDSESPQNIAAGVEGRTLEVRTKLGVAQLQEALEKVEMENRFILSQHNKYVKHVQALIASYESHALELEDGFATHKCVLTPYYLSSEFYNEYLTVESVAEQQEKENALLEASLSPIEETAKDAGMPANFRSLTFDISRRLESLKKIDIDESCRFRSELYECIDGQSKAIDVSAQLVSFLSQWESEVTQRRLTMVELREEWIKARVPHFVRQVSAGFSKAVSLFQCGLVQLLERENELMSELQEKQDIVEYLRQELNSATLSPPLNTSASEKGFPSSSRLLVGQSSTRSAHSTREASPSTGSRAGLVNQQDSGDGRGTGSGGGTSPSSSNATPARVPPSSPSTSLSNSPALTGGHANNRSSGDSSASFSTSQASRAVEEGEAVQGGPQEEVLGGERRASSGQSRPTSLSQRSSVHPAASTSAAGYPAPAVETVDASTSISFSRGSLLEKTDDALPQRPRPPPPTLEERGTSPVLGLDDPPPPSLCIRCGCAIDGLRSSVSSVAAYAAGESGEKSLLSAPRRSGAPTPNSQQEYSMKDKTPRVDGESVSHIPFDPSSAVQMLGEGGEDHLAVSIEPLPLRGDEGEPVEVTTSAVLPRSYRMTPSGTSSESNSQFPLHSSAAREVAMMGSTSDERNPLHASTDAAHSPPIQDSSESVAQHARVSRLPSGTALSAADSAVLGKPSNPLTTPLSDLKAPSVAVCQAGESVRLPLPPPPPSAAEAPQKDVLDQVASIICAAADPTSSPEHPPQSAEEVLNAVLELLGSVVPGLPAPQLIYAAMKEKNGGLRSGREETYLRQVSDQPFTTQRGEGGGMPGKVPPPPLPPRSQGSVSGESSTSSGRKKKGKPRTSQNVIDRLYYSRRKRSYRQETPSIPPMVVLSHDPRAVPAGTAPPNEMYTSLSTSRAPRRRSVPVHDPTLLASSGSPTLSLYTDSRRDTPPLWSQPLLLEGRGAGGSSTLSFHPSAGYHTNMSNSNELPELRPRAVEPLSSQDRRLAPVYGNESGQRGGEGRSGMAGTFPPLPTATTRGNSVVARRLTTRDAKDWIQGSGGRPLREEESEGSSYEGSYETPLLHARGTPVQPSHGALLRIDVPPASMIDGYHRYPPERVGSLPRSVRGQSRTAYKKNPVLAVASQSLALEGLDDALFHRSPLMPFQHRTSNAYSRELSHLLAKRDVHRQRSGKLHTGVSRMPAGQLRTITQSYDLGPNIGVRVPPERPSVLKLGVDSAPSSALIKTSHGEWSSRGSAASSVGKGVTPRLFEPDFYGKPV